MVHELPGHPAGETAVAESPFIGLCQKFFPGHGDAVVLRRERGHYIIKSLALGSEIGDAHTKAAGQGQSLSHSIAVMDIVLVIVPVGKLFL